MPVGEVRAPRGKDAEATAYRGYAELARTPPRAVIRARRTVQGLTGGTTRLQGDGVGREPRTGQPGVRPVAGGRPRPARVPRLRAPPRPRHVRPAVGGGPGPRGREGRGRALRHALAAGVGVDARGRGLSRRGGELRGLRRAGAGRDRRRRARGRGSALERPGRRVPAPGRGDRSPRRSSGPASSGAC